jgi:hypothetical protein
MAKKIKVTLEQLEEAMDIFVNKVGNESPEQALRRTQKETEQQVGGNKDVNYVISKDQISECKTYTKSQLIEARKRFLRENSNSFSKADFLTK